MCLAHLHISRCPTYPKRKRTTLEMTGTAPALVLISVVMWALHSGHCIDTESGPNIFGETTEKNPVSQLLPKTNGRLIEFILIELRK